MMSIPIGAAFVSLLFGSAMLAMFAARFLPDHHLTSEPKSVVSVSMAVVGTLSALVVGLLISNASASFSAKNQEITQMSADVIGMDRLFRRYGPEASDSRVLLRRYTEAQSRDFFPTDPNQVANLENIATISILEDLQSKILVLTPANDTQRWLQTQALQATSDIVAGRWRLGQESTNKTPVPLLVLVLFWFVIIFASFGLFAPRNLTSILAIFLCAIGIGSAIRMTTELQTPFRGMIRISDAPLVQALEVISH